MENSRYQVISANDNKDYFIKCLNNQNSLKTCYMIHNAYWSSLRMLNDYYSNCQIDICGQYVYSKTTLDNYDLIILSSSYKYDISNEEDLIKLAKKLSLVHNKIITIGYKYFKNSQGVNEKEVKIVSCNNKGICYDKTFSIEEDYFSAIDVLNLVSFEHNKVIEMEKDMSKFDHKDFIKLFLLSLLQKGKNTINIDNLGYQLYEFYGLEEYQDLFKNFTIKHQLEEFYIDMDDILEVSISDSLLDFRDNEAEKLITIDQNIINNYKQEYQDKMKMLVDRYIDKVYGKAYNKNKLP